MKNMSLVVNSNLTKHESDKHTFLQSKNTTQIRRYLILMLFVSTFLISESGVCAAGSDIRYGFWTIWRDPTVYQPDWNGLTHVAYSSWNVDSSGSLVAPPNMTHFTTVRDLTHSHGKKFIISVACSDLSAIDSIFANHREDLAKNVLSIVQKYGADGVNLDFEFPQQTNSITKTSNKVLFESLMSTLYNTMKTANSGYHISIDSTAGVDPVYANSNLAKYLDDIVIMDYDFQGGLGKTGPNSPYNDPTRYDVTKSVSDWGNYFNKQQMILGLPFYGYKYSSATDQPGSTFTKVEQIDMPVAIQAANQYGRLWDSNSNTPWCRYYDGSTWQQIWYDDTQSLKSKDDYVKSQNIAGVAFWALSCETPDVWSVFQSGQPANPVLPIANFSIDVTSGNIPLSVKFTDLSKGATGWKWDFGDGANSTVQSPTHTYSTAGSRTVTLTVSNVNGTDSESKAITVLASSLSTPVAAFSASPTSGNAPLTVSFTDVSTGSPTSWSWNFGDGTSSTVKSPAHAYKSTGSYTVSLTVKNATGSNAVTKSNYIFVQKRRLRS